MPIDPTINQTDDADSQGPKPPTHPVEFFRWVQRPRVNPKKRKVQPDDTALLPEPLEKPELKKSAYDELRVYYRGQTFRS
jgi:hypothetical protein